MLLDRSIFLQVSLLLLASQCLCQDYHSYDIEESDDGSETEDDSGPIDYSKYYSVDTSAPLIAQGNPPEIGFSSPIDFAGFFEQNLDFGASLKQPTVQPKNPFAAPTKSLGFNSAQFPDFSSGAHFPVDYFEEAQKANQNQNEESDFSPDTPEYISHNLPINLDTEYTSDVKKVQKPKTKKAENHKYDVEREAESDYDYKPNSPKKYTDYGTGKSSSTVAQYPQAAGYFEPTQTPYQKYSFQPVTEKSFQTKYLGDLISTVAPFNPAYNKIASTSLPNFETQGTENVPSHLKGKNCRRVKKSIPGEENHERRKREAMNCFICEDASSNAKYTQCSYAVEAEPTNDYSGISERYSTPAKTPDGFRYKRYSGDENVDPYEYIRSRSQKSYDKQEEETDKEFDVPEYYTDPGLEKSFSEVQSQAVSKDPKNCRKEVTKGMTCTICKDPKTGGNFEQCSYTSDPQEKKYAYVTEKKYNSDEPEEGSETKTKQVESKIKLDKPKESEKKKKPKIDESKYLNLEEFDLDQYKSLPSEESYKSIPKEKSYKTLPKDGYNYKKNYNGPQKFKLSAQYSDDSQKEPLGSSENFKHASPKKLINDDNYDIPKHFAESTVKEKKIVKGLEPEYYGSANSAETEGDDASSSNKEVDPYKEIEEYHFKLFPEFSHEESQHAEVVTNNPSADATRKDVEEVLEEFSKKDRTSCKKAEKKGMTCYLCVDKKGIQHEECMYVSESKPQASHVAYHELKQIKSPENKKEPVSAGTENKPIVSTLVPNLEAAASEGFETKIKYDPTEKSKRNLKKVRKSGKNSKEPKPAASNDAFDEPKFDTPAEFAVGPEEGAYAAETRPVYSKKLGVALPKYMVERSEFEKEFDAFAGTH